MTEVKRIVITSESIAITINHHRYELSAVSDGQVEPKTCKIKDSHLYFSNAGKPAREM